MTYAPRLIDYKRLPPRLVAALQAEVARLRGGTRRRTVEYTVALFPLDPTGVPLLEHRVPVASWPAGAMPGRGRPVLDHALRVDLLLAALPPAAAPGWDADRDAALVISRPGVLEPGEDDLGWLRAWPIACDIARRGNGPLWALTRHGWLDVAEDAAVVLPRHRLRRTGGPHTGRRAQSSPDLQAETSGPTSTPAEHVTETRSETQSSGSG